MAFKLSPSRPNSFHACMQIELFTLVLFGSGGRGGGLSGWVGGGGEVGG